MDKKDIASFGYDELIEEMKQIGEKPFRAKHIYSWLHEKLAESLDCLLYTYPSPRDTR